ncbi:hypothetical protein AB4Z51_27895 [Bradyrhizobium sp. 2TAF36]|uniref:hypothetical protein n=1 Tax=Bradyrhizobium sp. 2TAF36 TaxID=3233016 RepID=UPI003F8F907E
MSAAPGITSDLRARLDSKAALATLVLLHSLVTCLSPTEAATFQSYINFNPAYLLSGRSPPTSALPSFSPRPRSVG